MNANTTTAYHQACSADALRVFSDCISVYTLVSSDSVSVVVSLDVGESDEKRWCRAGVFIPICRKLLYLDGDKSIYVIGHGANGRDPNTCQYKIAQFFDSQGLKTPFFVSRRTSCYGLRTTCSVREDKVCPPSLSKSSDKACNQTGTHFHCYNLQNILYVVICSMKM